MKLDRPKTEIKCLEELKRLKTYSKFRITRIKSHKTDSAFVRSALQFADFTQSMGFQGDWPDGDFKWSSKGRVALAQNLIGTEKMVEAVSFNWGGKPRMTLRLRLVEADWDLTMNFFISDVAAAQAQADEFEAIAKSAKAPLAKRASAARL